MQYHAALIIFSLLFSQISSASIIGFPEEMIVMKCTDPSSGEVATEIYEIGTSYTLAFLVEGRPAGIRVVPVENGFASPNGSLQNVKLIRNANGKYSFAAYYANADGSNGEVISSPEELNCSAKLK